MPRPASWAPLLPQVAALQALVRRLDALHEMQQIEKNRPGSAAHRFGRASYLLADAGRQDSPGIADYIDTTPGPGSQSALLASIPGIGTTTAAAPLAEIGNVRQFASARQLTAFAGLDPRIRQSGSSVRGRSCLSKAGSPRLRRALYFPALAALRFNPAVAALRSRLPVAGKAKNLIVGAAMRKLLQIAFGVLKCGKPFDATIYMTDGAVRKELILALAA